MKKIFTILVASALIYSCGDNAGEAKQETQNQDKPAADTTPATTAPAADATASSDKGLELIGSNDCMACHSIDNKIIGPAYKDVAAKYENNQANVDSLVAKVKKGGMGNWGNVPMTPHPDLPDADAREMVKYILSLKK
jgi:cytochrome c